MKLKTCLEFGDDCGLISVGEALRNIDIHCMNIFSYDKINIELNELFKEFDESGLDKSTSILDAFKQLESE